MPYRAKGGAVYHKKNGKWVLKKRYRGPQAASQARKYATALNMGHARSKGYDVPPPRR